ncbi:MAG TPA: porin [Allosphingosinicella sp.]|nr:porin [Allosphingosinicella sp.]
MKKTSLVLLLATATSLSAGPALAQQTGDAGPSPRFQGAPRFGSTDGWSLKPRGRFQYDVGHISRPEGVTVAGLGSRHELRRARIGVEGTAPGRFGYVFEIDFAADVVEIVDANITYKATDEITLTAGQHNNFQSLDELTSSRFNSFIERAAFTDAFNFERRLGLSGTFAKGPVTAQVGVFHDNLLDIDDGDSAVGLDGRFVYAPRLGGTQLHFAGSAHWRDNGDLVANGLTTRYRQRPLIHATSLRFVATPALPVEEETHFGLEAALIRGPFHAAGEAHWLRADSGSAGDHTYFGAYAEVGYFLTGETRGYRGARFDRTRVRRSIEEGGVGAVQVNLRWDHLDLNSGSVTGGVQNGLQASLIWIPTDYVRFMLNYARLSYDGARIPAAGGDRDYGVDVIGARAQFDF